ncbi:MAG TPA: beta-1,6-N-acetylglucosaminyltransferase [Candidatus Tectomicrobia bacterium]|nr:beta-1,6-N-acetylglucosaminyltransferase [Candidatus Tectomicrobia bacterium]
MNVAYLISAYKLPEQLVRLVRRLHGDSSWIAVHVDRKAPARVYVQMVEGVSDLDRVVFVDRHVCHWGGFGHVRATLTCLDALYASGAPFDYAVLLTGQDYPLRARAEIERFLAEANGRSYISHWPLPHAAWAGRGGLDRVERWHAVWRRHLHVALPLRRRLPGGLVPWGGSPYWCLARPAVDHVRQVLRTAPELVRHFEHVWIPDELFFQTIVVNSPLRDTVVNDNLRYVDWSRRPAPAVLRRDDFEAMVGSRALFARKFDVTVDAEILDLLDRHADGRTHAV